MLGRKRNWFYGHAADAKGHLKAAAARTVVSIESNPVYKFVDQPVPRCGTKTLLRGRLYAALMADGGRVQKVA